MKHMNNEKFEMPEVKVVLFENEDVITSSPLVDTDAEGNPILPDDPYNPQS